VVLGHPRKVLVKKMSDLTLVFRVKKECPGWSYSLNHAFKSKNSLNKIAQHPKEPEAEAYIINLLQY